MEHKLTEYLKKMQAQQLSVHTLRRYFYDIDHFIKNVSTITEETIYKYFGDIQKEFKQNSVKRKYIIIKKFLKFCNIPCPDIKIRLERTTPDFLTTEEADNLRSLIEDDRDLLLFDFLYEMGVRIGEALFIKREDIVSRKLVIKGKGNKERILYMSVKLFNRLKVYIEETNGKMVNNADGKIFLNSRGSPLTVAGISFILKSYGKQIGKNVHPHTMRHSFATRLCQNNLEIEKIRQLLGHSDLQTTAKYLHVTIDENTVKDYWDKPIKE